MSTDTQESDPDIARPNEAGSPSDGMSPELHFPTACFQRGARRERMTGERAAAPRRAAREANDLAARDFPTRAAKAT